MRYIFLVALFLAPASIVSASEAETWKCKIVESMGIKKGPDGLRPTRYVIEDYEYRILNRQALFDAVGLEQVIGWMTESEQNQLPLDAGDYFYRSTVVSGKSRWDWSAMYYFGTNAHLKGDYAWFNTETGKFETHMNTGSWSSSGDHPGDYVFEFAKCTRFFD